MDPLEKVAVELNRLLSENSPKTFSSAWIFKRAPRCYGLIRKHIRSEVGSIDWDKITFALEPAYQRLWTPRVKKKSKVYRNRAEIDSILSRYKEKLYVFVSPADAMDLLIRDRIAIALVRVAQDGNLLARIKVIELVRYTIDEWLDTYLYMSRWRGRDHQIHEQLAGCIRRYRYSGSFLRYVYRTLQYAGRGIRPLYACSLDDPIAADVRGSKIDIVIRNSVTNEIGYYQAGSTSWFDSESQPDCY
jgi:hypothetical protein